MKYILLLFLLNNIVFAAPALQKWKEYKNGNEKITLKITGDEYFHSYKTINNEDVKFNNKEKKFFKYKINNNKIIYSSTPYLKITNLDENFKVNEKNLTQNQKKLRNLNKSIFLKRKK